MGNDTRTIFWLERRTCSRRLPFSPIRDTFITLVMPAVQHAYTYTGVLLCGGQSRRMKTDKAFIALPPPAAADATINQAARPVPLFYHLLQNALLPLKERLERIVISARDDAQEKRIRAYSSTRVETVQQTTIEVVVDHADYQNNGPASGILTAHSLHPASTLVILAVDFPQADGDTLRALLDGHETQDESAVTCFLHPEDGNPEPVMSVWTPAALERLKKNSALGKSGPCYTAKQLWRDRDPEKGMTEGGGLVRPAKAIWVRDADCPEEWQAIFGVLPQPAGQT